MCIKMSQLEAHTIPTRAWLPLLYVCLGLALAILTRLEPSALPPCHEHLQARPRNGDC